MSEYSDSIARAKRLSVAHEALVMGKPLVTESLVTLEDMQIYTRWLVSHYRSVKHVHSFLKVRNTEYDGVSTLPQCCRKNCKVGGATYSHECTPGKL